MKWLIGHWKATVTLLDLRMDTQRCNHQTTWLFPVPQAFFCSTALAPVILQLEKLGCVVTFHSLEPYICKCVGKSWNVAPPYLGSLATLFCGDNSSVLLSFVPYSGSLHRSQTLCPNSIWYMLIQEEASALVEASHHMFISNIWSKETTDIWGREFMKFSRAWYNTSTEHVCSWIMIPFGFLVCNYNCGYCSSILSLYNTNGFINLIDVWSDHFLQPWEQLTGQMSGDPAHYIGCQVWKWRRFGWPFSVAFFPLNLCFSSTSPVTEFSFTFPLFPVLQLSTSPSTKT